MLLVQALELRTESLFILTGQSSRVISLLEEVCLGIEVPCNLLSSALKSVETSMAAFVIINILEAWVLLNMGEHIAVVVDHVVNKDLGQVICSLHFLGEFLLLELLLLLLCCHFTLLLDNLINYNL